MTGNSFVRLLITVTVAFHTGAAATAELMFTGIGGLRPPAQVSTLVERISADGSTIVGTSLAVNGVFEAFRWSLDGGMQGLGHLDNTIGNRQSRAHGVSADGSVIAGQSPSRVSTLSEKSFRWTEQSGMEHVGNLPGGSYAGFARDVDSSGTYIVGVDSSTNSQPDNGFEAYRWSVADGAVPLGDLPGDRFLSEARAISGDGTTVVGYSESSNGNEAFRWTESGGMAGLGDLAGGTFDSFAEEASHDGSVIVGYGRSAAGFEAFRWTESGGMVGLGDLAGGSFFSTAYATSADGSLVGGIGSTDAGNEAFIWDAVNGMRHLQDYLTSLGLNTTGWRLTSLTGISDNGLMITGNGINPDGRTEGWYANLDSVPEPSGVALIGALAAAYARRRMRRAPQRAKID